MKKDELKQTVDYVKELEDALDEWDDRLIPWQIEMAPLSHTIQTLHKASYQTKDRMTRIRVVHIRHRANRCRRWVKSRRCCGSWAARSTTRIVTA